MPGTNRHQPERGRVLELRSVTPRAPAPGHGTRARLGARCAALITRTARTALTALLAACSSKDAGAPVSLDAGADATNLADATDASPTQLGIPASTGAWQATSDVTISGRGSGELGAISLTHGVGTITFHGAPAKAFFFVDTAVPLGTDAGAADGGLADERDFEILAEQDGRVIAAWLTCYKGSLAYVYYESTDGLASVKSQSASGTCTIVDAPTTETPGWPAVTFPAPSVVSGFTIAGADVAFDGTGPGSLTLNGARWGLYPFHTIDCTACASPGWWELHAILADPSGAGACLGILYLQKSAPASVELAYLMCLPGVTSPIPYDQKLYAASWTSP